jgi:hypothetical protein
MPRHRNAPPPPHGGRAGARGAIITSKEDFYRAFFYNTQRTLVVLSPVREPDPGDMYHFCDSFKDGRTGTRLWNHEHRPGASLVAKCHSYHYCDISP